MSCSRKSARLSSNCKGNENSPQNKSLSPKEQQNQSKFQNRLGNGPYKRNTRSSNASKNDTSIAEKFILKQMDSLSQSLMNLQEQDNLYQTCKSAQVEEKNEAKQETPSDLSSATFENGYQELEMREKQESSSLSLSEPNQQNEQAEDKISQKKEDELENVKNVKMPENGGKVEHIESLENLENVKRERIVAEESNPEKPVSATNKALIKLENNLDEKYKLKRGRKFSLFVRRRRLNKKLLKIMSPNCGTTLLKKLAPGCVFKTQENANNSLNGSSQFEMKVEYQGEVIGTGQGTSLSQCRAAAAEKAIKEIVSRKIVDDLKEKTNEGEETKTEKLEDSERNLPWTGLASFALYKLFSEWQIQDLDLSSLQSLAENVSEKPDKQPKMPRELPPNAAELHPTTLLCIMKPGVTAVELDRSLGPNPQVTMGYKIDDQMFTGTGSNKKNARKEAAKSAITALWGLEYS